MKKRSARILLTMSLCLAALVPGLAHASPAPLALDPSFGQGGVVGGGTSTDGFHVVAGVAADPGGGVLAVGVDFNSQGVAVARYLADGTLDPSYGEGGIASLAGAVSAVAASSLKSIGGIDRLAVDDQGRALLLWRGSKLTRLTAAGSVDPSFGTAGTVAISEELLTPHFTSVVPLASGRILLAGYGYGSPRMYVERLLPSGAVDTSFGRGGIVGIAIGDRSRNAGGLQMAVGPDGEITVAGYAASRPALVRLRADGTPDRRFGHNGRVVTPTGLRGEASALTLTRSGGALIGCRCSSAAGPAAVLLRFGPRGKLDRRFFAASTEPVGPNGFRPTSLHLAGKRVIAVGIGGGRSVRVFDASGGRGPTLAGVRGIPADRYFGNFSAMQDGKLLLAWTPKPKAGAPSEVVLERFLVR